MNNEKIQIKMLTIKDYLKIEFYKIDDAGNLVLITGDNETGKTSFLKAINEVFNPTATAKLPYMIHNEKDKAEILVEFTNGVTAERTMTQTSSKLKVIENNSPVNKPKEYLAAMVGFSPFNPIDFFDAKKDKRRQILLEASPFEFNYKGLCDIISITAKKSDLGIEAGTAMPIDLHQFNYAQHGLIVLDEIKKNVYGIRKTQNEHVVRLQKSLELEKREIPDTFDVEKFKDFDFGAKTEELKNANIKINCMKSLETEIEYKTEMRDKSVTRMQEIRDELDSLEQQIITDNEIIEDRQGELSRMKRPDIDSIQDELSDYNCSKRTILKLESIDQHEIDYGKEKEYHSSLDDFYKLLANDVPKHVLKTMPMPIAGIEFKDDDILIDGIEIDNLSTKQQIDLSVQIAMSLTKAGFICIDRFESFSPNNQQLFLDACHGKGFQLFVTSVDSGELKVSSSAT